MKFNRALIGNYLLVTMVSLLLFSFCYPPALQKDFEKDSTTQLQIKENFEDPESNLLRSGTEALSGFASFSADYNFTPFEYAYDAFLKTQFSQIKMDSEAFKSSFKIYLHLLKILV